MSIKLRVALVFTLALAIAFALGSWLFVVQLAAQQQQATDRGLAIQLDAARQYFPKAGSTIRPPGESYVIQIIGPSGKVVNASPDFGGTPLPSAAQLAQARGRHVAWNASIDEESYRLLAGRLPGHPGWVAVAGISRTTESDTVRTAATGLVIGGVIFVLLGGLGAYWLAATALSPVERMRREVAALSEQDTQGRVRVPRTRDELAALAGTMNALLARLQGALARQRGFVADASHELRTPLAVLGAELELAGRPGRSRDELVQAVANAEDEVARLTRITNDLLVLARSDEGRLPVRVAPTGVRGLLERSADRAAGRAAQGSVTCVVDAPPGLVANLDEDRIRQAVDNLIDNALRFAPPGSAVAISGRSADGRLVIEVADQGPGFPAGFLPHAFERFGRPDTPRGSSEGGAGLGLAIVAAIAAAHGGVATARNGPSGGAAVTIDLPAAIGQTAS
ncbi:MAG TPA: ATP-binding protein [Streptosporangiaceae bacterium]